MRAPLGRDDEALAVERARLTVVPRRRTRASRVPFVALVSMMLLGGPLYLLFEFGLVLQRVMPASKVADGFRSKKSDSESGSAS